MTYEPRAADWPASCGCGCGCILPLCFGFVSEFSQRGTGHEVALNIEIIVDGGMGAEKALGGSC